MSAEPRAGVHGAWRTFREAMRLYWNMADAFAKRRVCLALVTVAAGALLAALTPIALKLAVDALSNPTRIRTVWHAPLVLVAVYVGGQYLWRCTTELRTMLHGHAEQRVRRRIGLQLFEHLIHLPLRFHLERKTGAVGQMVEQGLRGYEFLLLHLVYTMLPVTIEFVVVVIVMLHFQHGPYLAILGVAAIAYLFAFHRWASAVHGPSERITQTLMNSSAVLSDILLSAEAVKYFAAERVVSRKYDEALRQTESAWGRFFSSYASNGLIVASIFAASLGASLVLATRDVARGSITVGGFVLINAYVVRLVQPLELLGTAVRDLAQGLAYLQAMLKLLREKTEEREFLPQREIHPYAELSFERVTFSYHPGRTVLKDVSFRVPAGKTVAVVGVSGSGKSSLIRLVFRLYEPDSGRILLDGIPISEMALSAVRSSIAIVPQDTVLLNASIASNLALARAGCTRTEIEAAARVASLHDFVMGLPEEYETVVGERGLKLSGGERQRVAIARAVLKRPRIAVFDEATSNLDSATEAEILRNLSALSARCTTLVVAHRLSTIVHADEIIVLREGGVVEQGTHEQLRKANAHYAALWNVQQSGM